MRSLYNVSRNLDLDQAEGLSNFDRRLICVPEHCPKSCSARRSCRYRKYLEEANGRRVTIQICNHNFLLADATHRQEKWPRLLKNYQALVIDEAHKLPEAAAQMYGRRFSVQDGENLCRLLEKNRCTHTAQQLRERLTALQAAFFSDEGVDTVTTFCPDDKQKAALLSERTVLRQAVTIRTTKPLPAWLLHRLRESADILQLFIEQNRIIFCMFNTIQTENQPFAPTVVTCLPGWTKPCGVFGKRPSSPPAHCPLVGILHILCSV